MIEVEIKVPVFDEGKLIRQLEIIGFKKSKLVRESDLYFDNANGQIKKEDGALRIRSCENITENTKAFFLTYKGPKMDEISMTRKELETQLSDMETGKQILISLGYERLYPVIKTRQYYLMDRISACLDHVENLGIFLELEIVVESERQKEEALEGLINLITKLGYQPNDFIQKSYLSMLQV